MFGGFISAVSHFTGEATKDEIERISMGKIDLYVRNFEKFKLVISTKKGKAPKDFHNLIIEVGESFRIQYKDLLEVDIVDTESFEPFSRIIDQIFGIETIKVIPEHHELLKIIREAEEKVYSEEETVNLIINFYSKLDSTTKRILLQTTKNILSLFEHSRSLSSDYKEKLKEIYTF
ncbi:MAG: hypothetical protein ACFFBD_01975 [Candidatus Hodarchaeota archaeon]